MQLAIRADGSHDIGLGHLYRSSIVAEEALTRGHTVTILTRTPEFAEMVAPDRVVIESLPKDDERCATIDWIAATEADAVVTDSNDVDTAYQRQLSTTDATVAVLLDDARYRIHSDILINGNLYANDLNYDWSGTEPIWCLGIDYLLLREPFRTYATDTYPFPESVSNVLVTMGGVDRENRTPDVLSGVSSLGVDITVIIGPGFNNEDEIQATVDDLDCQVTVRKNPDDLPELFLNADLAVCTLGTTTYELLATQTPIVGIPDNETPIHEALEKIGAALVLPRNPDPSDVERAVQKVVSDRELRRSLWGSGDTLISGDGAENVMRTVERTALDH
jgi:spore coat polysaccharide biosynthesis predicted glycosyltransferase SpsG